MGVRGLCPRDSTVSSVEVCFLGKESVRGVYLGKVRESVGNPNRGR